MTGSPDEPAPSKNNDNKLAFSKNDNSRPASEKNNGNDKIDRFGGDGMEYSKKSGKSKSQKLAKSQKLSKSRKSKSRNLSNFNVTKTGISFLSPDAKTAFNRLRLAFIKASIL